MDEDYSSGESEEDRKITFKMLSPVEWKIWIE